MKEEFDLVIEPGRIEKNYWQDIWRYRELFYILSWRDIKVRYKQTVIGITWSIIRPLLTMLIFTFVFGLFILFVFVCFLLIIIFRYFNFQFFINNNKNIL